jgi:hypothetical protein
MQDQVSVVAQPRGDVIGASRLGLTVGVGSARPGPKRGRARRPGSPSPSEQLPVAPTPIRTLIPRTPSLEVHVITVASDLPLPIEPILARIPPVIVVPVGIVDDIATGTACHRRCRGEHSGREHQCENSLIQPHSRSRFLSRHGRRPPAEWLSQWMYAHLPLTKMPDSRPRLIELPCSPVRGR